MWMIAWDKIVGWIRQESAATTAMVQAFIALGIAFSWWTWSPAQTGAVIGIVAALLGMFVRSQVTPIVRGAAAPRRPVAARGPAGAGPPPPSTRPTAGPPPSGPPPSGPPPAGPPPSGPPPAGPPPSGPPPAGPATTPQARPPGTPAPDFRPPPGQDTDLPGGTSGPSTRPL